MSHFLPTTLNLLIVVLPFFFGTLPHLEADFLFLAPSLEAVMELTEKFVARSSAAILFFATTYASVPPNSRLPYILRCNQS
jgi:hypothetical protein